MEIMMNSELQRIAKIASDSKYAQGGNGWTTAYSFQVFSRFFSGDSILEMGPAEGVMTELLAKTGMDLSIVEGSNDFCLRLQKMYPQAHVTHSLFEDYRPTRKFDNIILGHVLEHVENPKVLLTHVKSWLKPGGRVICAVPNSRSLQSASGGDDGAFGF